MRRDAAARRHLDSAFSPHKGLHGEDNVYVGPIFTFVWLCAVIWAGVRAYRSEATARERSGRFTLPLFIIFGTFGLWSTLDAAGLYAQTCRGLLDQGSAPTTTAR